MIKKLTAKTQELNPKLPQFSSSFSKCISIPPESKDVQNKKGAVYALFEISGGSNFDTELVSKVVSDVVHDFYYESENISPIQSMEKALSETEEKVSQLSNDTLISDPQSTHLNFVSAILWGNVVYVIKYGEADTFIMKGGEVSPLEMVSEGKFSSFSKLAAEDEILMFCTKSFSETFPMEKLLSSSILENDMRPNQSCMLMRLLKDTSEDQEDEIDYGLGDAVLKKQAREKAGKVVGAISNIKNGASVVLINFLKVLGPVGEQISNIIGKVIPKRKAVLISRKITQVGGKEGKKARGWVFLVIVAVLLAVSVFYTFKSKIFKDQKDSEKIADVKPPAVEEIKEPEEDRSKDTELKITRVTPEVFYDIKITDVDANPTEIQIVKDKIVVVDKNSGKIYHSDINNPNFTTDPTTFQGIRKATQSDDFLAFIDSEGYKTYDILNSKTEESYKMDPVTEIYPYSGYIYSISNDIMTRSSENNGILEGVLWGQNPDFQNVRSMAIAYSVYILKDNGELVNYSGGIKTDFTVSGLDQPFQEPVKVVADLEIENIYVADRGNKRIVVLDNKGALVKQYKHDDSDLWKDIRGISVSSDEKTIFLLDSTKVYKISVEN